jgi:hypothetical protein
LPPLEVLSVPLLVARCFPTTGSPVFINKPADEWLAAAIVLFVVFGFGLWIGWHKELATAAVTKLFHETPATSGPPSPAEARSEGAGRSTGCRFRHASTHGISGIRSASNAYLGFFFLKHTLRVSSELTPLALHLRKCGLAAHTAIAMKPDKAIMVVSFFVLTGMRLVLATLILVAFV